MITIDSIYNQNVRDQFIIGLQSDELRRRLLTENTLTLDKAVQIALAHESSTVKADEMHSTSKSLIVPKFSPLVLDALHLSLGILVHRHPDAHLVKFVSRMFHADIVRKLVTRSTIVLSCNGRSRIPISHRIDRMFRSLLIKE